MDLNLDVLPRGPLKLNFGRASQRSIEFGRASQRSDGLKFRRASQRSNGFEFGRASQRFDGFEIWTCFLEVQWNWKVLFIPMCVGLLP